MGKKLLAGLVALGLLFSFGIGKGLAGEEGLVLYFPFDEGEGDVVKDKSGKGNDGKLLEGVGRAKGIEGPGVGFDGEENHYVKVSNSPSLNFADGSFSISVWVRKFDCEDAGIVSKYGSYNYPQFFLSATSKVSFRINDNKYRNFSLFFMLFTIK